MNKNRGEILLDEFKNLDCQFAFISKYFKLDLETIDTLKIKRSDFEGDLNRFINRLFQLKFDGLRYFDSLIKEKKDG